MIEGFDISHHNGVVNWDRVARNKDLEFVFIKATQGSHFVDPQLDANTKGSLAAGLKRGFYHYLHASENPLQQASFFVSKISPLLTSELPPVCDFETLLSMPAPEAIANVRSFLEEVAILTQRLPILYTSPGFLLSVPSPLLNQLSKFPLWIAEYSVQAAHTPKQWRDWTFWQHTDKGGVGGVKGLVDMNYFNGTLEELAEL